ncbi:uncharacterized protein TNCV_4164001 [Trichonephila clavipes]|nr:uncharacterized protein TNCV_4164001 [Trichonephila clavipes]
MDELIEMNEQEQGIEELESLEAAQSEDRITWLTTLTTVTFDLDSNPGEDIDVCKCIVPSRHGGTLNSRRAASPLSKLLAGDERWEAPNPPLGCSPAKLVWNRAKTYCHLYGAQD